MKLPSWLKEALSGPERTERYTNAGMVAYYWDGGAPKKHAVRDISSGGAYLVADEPWCAGTIITLTLQKEAEDGEGAATAFAVLNCRVVRHTTDGAEIEFMLRTEEERKALKQFMRRMAMQKTGMSGKVGESGSEGGQALVEFVAVIPLLFLLIALTFNFGTWLYGWVAVGNAARAAGDYAILGGAYAGLPPTATSATLQALVTADLAHVPGTNRKACIRQNNNGTYTTLLQMPSGACGSFSNPPPDPEPATYVSVAVDVSYTYTSFFTGSSVLGLPLTVLPGTIHRRAVMRMVQ